MNVQTFVEINKITFLTRIISENSASWHGSYLSVLTDQALEVLELSRNMLSISEDLHFTRTYISPSQFAPSEHFKSKFHTMFPNLTNEEMVDCMTEPNICPKLDFTLPLNITIISTAWSPNDLIYNNKNVVAVLTNVGAVDIVAKQRSSWVSLCNLSRRILNHYSLAWQCAGTSENFDDLKKCCKDLETCAMAWSSLTTNKTSSLCYFVTAQQNSDILIWLVENKVSGIDNEFNVELKNSLNSNIGVVNLISWIKLNRHDKSFLVCAGQNGQLTIHALKIKQDNVSFGSSQILWTDTDYINIKCLVYFEHLDHIIICFIKSTYFISILLDYSLNIICTNIENMGGAKVTGCIKLKNDSIIICTYESIKRVIVEFCENKMTVKICDIIFNYDFSTWAVMGICCSYNEAIFALSLNRRRIDQTRSKVKALTLYLQIENFDCFKIIFDNPSQKLTYLWDCIELARVTAHRIKKIPAEFKSRFSNVINSTTYNLQVYLILINIYDFLIQKNSYREDIVAMFTVSQEQALNTIINHHAISQILELAMIHSSKGLDDFQLQSLQCAYEYLRDNCKINKKEITNIIDSNVIEKLGDVIDVNRKVICEFCTEEVEKYKCKNNHCMQWCVLSFLPVSDDYLLCPVCGTLARTNLYLSKPVCIICNSYMEKSFTK